MSERRTCRVCGDIKPLTDEFWPRNYKKGKPRGHMHMCRSCAAVKSRRWRLAHLEYARERDRQYRLDNLERITDRLRGWRDANRDKIRAAGAVYHRRNRLKRLAQHREWMARNPGYSKAYMRQWLLENREMARENRKARRARLRAGGRLTVATIRQVKEKQGNGCYYCNTPMGPLYHLDHKTPTSRGGTNSPENLCFTCPRCNLSKQDKTEHEYRAWCEARVA